jgi:hypothetical protein
MSDRERVIFIRGVMVRSGTNFLRDLLLLHPDCDRARPPVWEDFALHHASLLRKYAWATAAHWSPSWPLDRDQTVQAMIQTLGDGLLSFLVGEAVTEKVAAKTPSTVGLENAIDLFPQAPLLLLVRDGRSVVESAVRSFGWTFERATQHWTAGAKAVVDFDERHHDDRGARYRVVRYESLLDDMVAQLTSLLEFCGLDPSQFDFDAAVALPVRGSSTFGSLPGCPHWAPVEKDPSFDPRARWQGWSTDQHERFDWVAGSTMAALGYERHGSSPIPPGRRRMHRSRDLAWTLSKGSGPVRRRLKQELRRVRPLTGR